MKQLMQLSLFTGMLITMPASAFSPIDGFYGGLLGEVSHVATKDTIQFVEDGSTFKGTVGYSPISGGAGGMLGYKYRHFRIEAELLYNRVSKGPLTVGTCTLQSPNVLTPTGQCPVGQYDHFKVNALGYSGSSAAIYGLVNGFWDFFSYDSEATVVPYLGLGLGKVQIKNKSNFVNTITLASLDHSTSLSSAAYQGILGISYYMDDFTWATMDFRYLSTQNSTKKNVLTTNLGNPKYTLSTLNFTVNFAFDKGAINS
ncbi:MAG: hypothetical protein PSV35_09175 [bacterium]|nr:hypothetical protein [bacterium]